MSADDGPKFDSGHRFTCHEWEWMPDKQEGTCLTTNEQDFEGNWHRCEDGEWRAFAPHEDCLDDWLRFNDGTRYECVDGKFGNENPVCPEKFGIEVCYKGVEWVCFTDESEPSEEGWK